MSAAIHCPTDKAAGSTAGSGACMGCSGPGAITGAAHLGHGLQEELLGRRHHGQPLGACGAHECRARMLGSTAASSGGRKCSGGQCGQQHTQQRRLAGYSSSKPPCPAMPLAASLTLNHAVGICIGAEEHNTVLGGALRLHALKHSLQARAWTGMLPRWAHRLHMAGCTHCKPTCSVTRRVPCSSV